MRITANVLKDAVAHVNYNQMYGCGAYFFKYDSRYEHHAIDLYGVDQDGKISCIRNVEIGTARACHSALFREGSNVYGRIPHYLDRPTRKMAKVVLGRHMKLDADYHECVGASDAYILIDWAKKTKYRQSRNSNGSLARDFYYHLAKVKV